MKNIELFILLILFSSGKMTAQSPHGKSLKIDCSQCHLSTGWDVIPEKISFDHNKETSFQLTGAHQGVECKSCHKSLIFSDIKNGCINCHKDIHQNSVGQNCIKCHTTNSWIVTNIKVLHEQNRFPLTGVHLNVDCASCHTSYSMYYFQTLSTSCFSCHSSQFYSAQSPNHVNAGFSTECQDCHTFTSFAWSADGFNHSFFPLTGGHNISNCFACHTPGSNFKGLTTDCYQCHSKDYLAATDPNHVQQNFPHICSQCHSTINWSGATFDHSTTGFALTGAHATLSCSQCHASGYTSTPSACYSCHQNDYANTSNPPHQSVGYPTDCTQCHTTSAWQPSTFNHSQFPISSGRHSGLSCSTCHTAFSNFAVFSCTTSGCHSQASTDGHHDGVSGYVYSPTSCYGCHSNGRAGD